MKNSFAVITTIVAVAAAIAAQDQSAPLAYVASVKKNAGGPGSQIRIRPGNISVSGTPLRILIRQAFSQPGQLLQDFQLVGGPAWINSDRFDIELKLEDQSAPVGPQFVPNAFRQLLEDRFKLKVHTETREVPVFALVLARSDGRLGPELKPSSPECTALMAAGPRGRVGRGPDGPGGPPPDGPGGPPRDGRSGPPPDGRGGIAVGRGGPPPAFNFDGPAPCGSRGGGFGRFRAGGVTMAQFAAAISGNAQRIVIDKTGLAGYYDIALTYTPTPDQLPQGPAPPGVELPAIDPNGPSLFTAIQEQLGLKLDNQRGPVDVVVIDSVDQPTEN